MTGEPYCVTLMPGGLAAVERRIEHVVDDRWLLAYATSVGDRRPAVSDLDTPGGIIGHPVFPVCLEWPLIMAGSPGVELSPGTLERGLHVTHRIVLHQPIRAGQRLVSSARLVALERRSVGTYVGVQFETNQGTVPTVSSYVGMLYRGVDVVGAQSRRSTPARVLAVPEATMRIATFDVDETNAVIYTECARIWNPIHTDIRVARAGGLRQTVLHGTECLARAMTAVLAYLPSQYGDMLATVECRFADVVEPGSSLRIMVSELVSHGPVSAIGFEVHSSEHRRAIRDGYATFDQGRPSGHAA